MASTSSVTMQSLGKIVQLENDTVMGNTAVIAVITAGMGTVSR